MTFRTALLAVTSLAMPTWAFAEDLQAGKEPAFPQHSAGPWSWSGFYAGSSAGVGIGSAGWVDTGYNPIFYNGAGPSSNALRGLTLGAVAGMNYQVQRFVIGAEGDLDVSNLTSSGESSNGAIKQANAGVSRYSFLQQFNETAEGRIRARLGYAIAPQVLLYAAGGLTVANLESSFDGYCCGSMGGRAGNVGPGRTVPPTYFHVSNGRVLEGFNVGAGVRQNQFRLCAET